MHEFFMCQAIVQNLIAEVRQRNEGPVRVVKTRVSVGALRQVIPEYLQTAYEVLTKDTIAEGSSLEIKTIPMTGRCESCGWHGPLSATDIRCGACQSGDVEITTGQEICLDSVEIEDGEHLTTSAPA